MKRFTHFWLDGGATAVGQSDCGCLPNPLKGRKCDSDNGDGGNSPTHTQCKVCRTILCVHIILDVRLQHYLPAICQFNYNLINNDKTCVVDLRSAVCSVFQMWDLKQLATLTLWEGGGGSGVWIIHRCFCQQMCCLAVSRNVSRLVSYLPQCMYAVNDLGHVFAIVHIRCFRVEYLEADAIQKGPVIFSLTRLQLNKMKYPSPHFLTF